MKIHATIHSWLSTHIARIPSQCKLVLLLGLVVGFSLSLTIISINLYRLDGSYKLDLSRPGFEGERAQVLRTIPGQQTYDTTSPVTSDAITKFLQDYNARTKALSQYGSFKDQALDDTSVLNGGL